MAKREEVLKTTVEGQDKLSQVLTAIGRNLEGFASKVQLASGVAFGVLTYNVNQGITAINEYQAAQEKLNLILKNSQGYTREQTQELVDYAEALELTGVATKDGILAVQTELAQIGLKSEAIKELTPTLVDYVVATKGATAGISDFAAIGDTMTKVLNGKTKGLDAAGFKLDEYTKKIFESGTESEKLATLQDLLNSKYTGANKAALDTGIGQQELYKRNIGDIQEAIGVGLLPVLNGFYETLNKILKPIIDFANEHKTLTNILVLSTLTLLAFGTVITPIMTGITALTGAVSLLSNITKLYTGIQLALNVAMTANPIGVIVVAIGALVTAFIYFRDTISSFYTSYKNWIDSMPILGQSIRALLMPLELILWTAEKIGQLFDLIFGKKNAEINVSGNIADSITTTGFQTSNIDSSALSPTGNVKNNTNQVNVTINNPVVRNDQDLNAMKEQIAKEIKSGLIRETRLSGLSIA